MSSSLLAKININNDTDTNVTTTPSPTVAVKCPLLGPIREISTNDVIFWMVEYLGYNDLNSFSRSCKYLHRLLKDVLLKRKLQEKWETIPLGLMVGQTSRKQFEFKASPVIEELEAQRNAGQYAREIVAAVPVYEHRLNIEGLMMLAGLPFVDLEIPFALAKLSQMRDTGVGIVVVLTMCVNVLTLRLMGHNRDCALLLGDIARCLNGYVDETTIEERAQLCRDLGFPALRTIETSFLYSSLDFIEACLMFPTLECLTIDEASIVRAGEHLDQTVSESTPVFPFLKILRVLDSSIHVDFLAGVLHRTPQLKELVISELRGQPPHASEESPAIENPWHHVCPQDKQTYFGAFAAHITKRTGTTIDWANFKLSIHASASVERFGGKKWDMDVYEGRRPDPVNRRFPIRGGHWLEKEDEQEVPHSGSVLSWVLVMRKKSVERTGGSCLLCEGTRWRSGPEYEKHTTLHDEILKDYSTAPNESATISPAVASS